MKASLGFKLTGAFLVVALIAAGVGAVGFWNQNRLSAALDHVHRDNVRGLDRAGDLATLTARHYRALVNHGLNADTGAMANLERDLTVVEEEFTERYQVYQEAELVPEERSLLNAIHDDWNAYLAVTQDTLGLSRGGAMDAELAVHFTDELGPAYATVDAGISEITDLNRERAALANEDAQQMAGTAATTMIILVVIGVGVAIALGLFISLSTVRPLKTVSRRANEIADGEIYQDDIELKRRDEIGELAGSFNRMIAGLGKKTAALERIAKGDLDFTVDVESEKDVFGRALATTRKQLNEVLLQMTESVEQVSAGAGEVSDASQNLSQGATEQASSLEEITSSMVELSSQSRQNATNAGEANNLSRNARQSARDGDEQMQKLVEHMKSIDTSSEAIKKIITVIDDIAFQINLLALNANVEAARAGQHGRGFAVVAEEVRNLAVRSTQSVKETSEKIEQSIATIQAGNEVADATAERFRTIVEGVSKVADLMEEISAASQEQSSGLEQVNASVEQIDQVTQTNTSSAEQTAAAAEELSAQARALQEQTSMFKLNRQDALVGSAAHQSGNGNGHPDMSSLTPEMIQYLQEQIAGRSAPVVPAARSEGGIKPRQERDPAAVTATSDKGIALTMEDEEFDEF